MTDGDFENAEIVESAKAIQEVAKTTGKAIDGLQSSGSFFGKIFGGLVEDGVGIVADKVKFMRFERAAELASKAEKILEERGIGEDDLTKAVPPKTAIPLIENATLEDDDNLHDLWAKLLANAMDPNMSIEVNRIHVSLLKELEQIDVMILNTIFNDKVRTVASEKLDDVLYDKSKIIKGFNFSPEAVELSLLNLMRVGCIKPGVIVNPGIAMGGQPATAYKGTDMFHLSQLGLNLCQAVS
ncbi:Abi-alpha family protein [Kordiimonas sp. SCSIO 12610]|uniref:Abi-alpha family protein n=1 Tax=Kordiimonas sp. SCSIO 12610 TaxID=2829597 RepID=UPI00210C55AE|nr:Abi-alpha family protein [Kordiimonas sp. SCSIO 12610]UTW56690.1 DUF4393 domain-containing protein [Kordiimonas sp. SCSIO 12610]